MTCCASSVNTVLLFLSGVLSRCWVVGMIICGAETAYGDWELVWSDEFNGSAINATNWTFDFGNGSGGWGNNELEYHTSRTQNVYVANGLLHIVAQKESYMGYNYTSAKLKTLGLFGQTYGRYEFYARLPQGQGYWPALWMMPEDSVFGGWAASGEIDVMENKGSNPTNVLGTIHFGGMYPKQAQSYGPSFFFQAATQSPIFTFTRSSGRPMRFPGMWTINSTSRRPIGGARATQRTRASVIHFQPRSTSPFT